MSSLYLLFSVKKKKEEEKKKRNKGIYHMKDHRSYEHSTNYTEAEKIQVWAEM